MGTNYYALPIKMLDEIDISDKLSAYQSTRYIKPIHIGKKSMGWCFLYNHNNWEYYTHNNLYNFLEGCIIINEYDEIIPLPEFKRISFNMDNVIYSRDAIEYRDHFKKYGNFWFSKSTEFS